MLARGHEFDEVADVLPYSTRWVRLLPNRYNEGGPDRLGDQRVNNGTQATILKPQAMEALEARLRTAPDDGGQWTTPKIARWLAKFHGLKHVHEQRGWDALMAIEWSIHKPRPRHPQAAGARERARLKKLQRAVAAEKRVHPDAKIEVWASDGRRVGLEPITRGVWAPKGQRPIALGHHRFEWLYVTGFVEPATGKTVWNVSNAICKEMFEAILRDFAANVGVGAKKRVVLQLDNAGWHGPMNLALPDALRLVFQPPHSPELQPAERLWRFVDERLVNEHFATLADLDRVVARRCVELTEQRDMIRASTLFHWWPRSSTVKQSNGDGIKSHV